MIALRSAMFERKSGGKSVTFVDGEYYSINGEALQFPSYSRIDTFIPVIGGHTVRWTWGTGASAYSPLLEYDDGTRIDYWSSTGSSGYRQVTLDAWCTRVRFAVPIDSKSIASLYDVTDGRYIFVDGKLA